jgi:pilus assembly protein CpaF
MVTTPEAAWQRILPFLRPIEALIHDPDVSDIMINGEQGIFFEKFGVLEQLKGVAISEERLQIAAQNIARAFGADISEACPLLETILPDGSRVAIVLWPIAVNGTSISIRKFHRQYTGAELVRIGAISADGLELLRRAIVDRQNILISGGTGTGKTTVANALSQFIPDRERIITIEDTPEIQIEKPNVTRFQARREQPGLPPIRIRDLLRQSLRMRPDRIIIGEVRGEEALDLLQAMNTGHEGSFSTIHANSGVETLTRFAHCVMMSRTRLPHQTICGDIADAIDLVVHIRRRDDGRRHVSEVLRVHDYDMPTMTYEVETVFSANGSNK